MKEGFLVKTMMKYTGVLGVFLMIFSLASCSIIYRYAEGKYQADADIVRLHHFDYYARLLNEYHEKTAQYPFQNQKDAPVYVYIQTAEQEKQFTDTNPYIHYTVNDTWFFQELSEALGREIDEKYDPQQVSSDGRPNEYIYMIDGDVFYFTIYLYKKNPFTKRIAKYYYKMELSSIDSSGYVLFSYETLKNNPQYHKLLNRAPAKQGFFATLDRQYSRDSRR